MIKFGTDGWRGVIADDFTFDRLWLVACAIARYVADSTRGREPLLLVGYDTRFNSDRFAQLCAEWGVTQSMGSVGTSADNALAESFNATLKRETLQGGHAWPDPRNLPARGVPVGDPLQHPPSSLLVRPASPDRLRAAARRYAAACRLIDPPVSTIRG